ncbi:MAG TPA: ribonuclease D [Gemmatimonadales bacterium]|nr:ribonuclease D [Gemmatimonadales bacterium]
MSDPHPSRIDTQTAFETLLAELGREPLLAVDTEAASFHRYHDRVYLVQLSSRTRTAIVDPLAVTDLAPLGQLLADPRVEVVFHDADYDLRLLDQQYGFRAARLFDTRVAAQLLNEPGIGLAALLEKYLDVRLDKRFQRADWSIRPLPPEMLEYAASDTRHLPALRDILRARLAEFGRLTWAEEEFALLERVKWGTVEDDEPAYLRVKGAKLLRGRHLAALRELHQWREETAARTDRAAFRILNTEPLLAIAKALPADVGALRAIRGVGPDLVDRRGREILAAVQRALDLAEGDLPRIERGPRRVPDPAFEARVDRLKAKRNELATRLELAPGVLCPNATLEAIARARPQTIDELRGIPGIRRWQAETFGEELLGVVAAELAEGARKAPAQ